MGVGEEGGEAMRLAKIDVMKIDKTKLVPGKTGAKWLDLVIIENKAGRDEYGNDGFISQGVSKEAREAGVKGAILGNWRRVGEKSAAKKAAVVPPTPPPDSEDVPW